MKTKMRYSKKKTSRKGNSTRKQRGGFFFGTNKLTFDIDFNSDDGGFSILSSNKLKNYLLKSIKDGKNLIQTVPGKNFYTNKPTKIQLQAVTQDSWKLNPTWSEIDCQSKDDITWMKNSPCGQGTKQKVFVKYKSNKNVAGFGVYLLRILMGDIDKEKHLEFVKVLKETMTDKPIMIDNRDVDWFHLKSVEQ